MCSGCGEISSNLRHGICRSNVRATRLIMSCHFLGRTCVSILVLLSAGLLGG